jgi:hypothetical protein
MTTEQTNALTDAITRIPPSRYHEIRNAYYKAAEGLRSLADALEIADVEEGVETVLLDIHLVACQALDAIVNTRLGQVL